MVNVQTSKRHDSHPMDSWQTSRLGCDSGLHLCRFLCASACEAGAAAELTATCRMAKYSDLSDQYTFTLEMLHPFNEMAYKLVGDLGRSIAIWQWPCEFFFVPGFVQRFTSILLHDSFLVVDHLYYWSLQLGALFVIIIIIIDSVWLSDCPCIIYTRWVIKKLGHFWKFVPYAEVVEKWSIYQTV